jgi:hypothetical protein
MATDTIKIEIKGVVAPSNEALHELMENLLHQIEDRVEPPWFDYDKVSAKAGIWRIFIDISPLLLAYGGNTRG